MNQPARTRLSPPFVLSLVMLASLYIFAYYPLTYLFHLERGGTLQALPMVSCILLGVILAAVVHMLLGGESMTPYAILTAVLYLAALALSWVFVLLFHNEYNSFWAILLHIFPQSAGMVFMLPGVAAHLLALFWLHRRHIAE